MSDKRIFPLRPKVRERLHEKSSTPGSLLLMVESFIYRALAAGATRILIELDLSPSVYKLRFMDDGKPIGYKEIPSNWIKSSRRVQISSENHCWIFREGKFEENSTRNVDNEGPMHNEMIFSDFLYLSPVRQRILHPYRDVEEIRIQVVVPYSLLHFDVHFMLTESRTKEIVYSVKGNCKSRKQRFISHLNYCKIPFSESHMREISQKLEVFHVIGLMSTLGIPEDKHQFLFLNGRSIQKTKWHGYINGIVHKYSIHASASSNPCYILAIKCPENEYNIMYESKMMKVEFVRYKLLTELLKNTILTFLSQNGIGAHLKHVQNRKGPRINASSFSMSGVTPLESTSKEDPRILAHVLKRKQDLSQFQIADLHDGVRKGLPAQKLRVVDSVQGLNNVLDDDLLLNKFVKEDDVMSSARSADFPDIFGVRSQSLKNTSSLHSSSSSCRSYDKNNREVASYAFLNNSMDEECSDFPLSSTLTNRIIQNVSPMETKFSMDESNTTAASHNYSAILESTDDPSISGDRFLNIGHCSPPPFNFIELDNFQQQPENCVEDESVENKLVDTLNVDVTGYSEDNSFCRKFRSKSSKKIYKEFLLQQMKQIQQKIDQLNEEESSPDHDASQELQSVETPKKVPGIVIQSQITTTQLQVDPESKSCPTEEIHATFRVIDQTLAYPEDSILKSSKIPYGWIKKSLTSGEDIFIHLESGFTVNSIEEISQKSNPPHNKKLLDVVRDRGSFPENTGMDKPNIKSDQANQLIQSWKNPVIKSIEDNILSTVSKPDGGGRTVNAVENMKFDKSVFQNLKVLYQLDNKVIVTLLNDEVVVLLDQHAVHERIRLEKLIKDNYLDNNVSSSELTTPVAISISASISRLLLEYPYVLSRFGLKTLEISSEDILVFTHVPNCFIYQGSNESKYNTNTPLKELIILLCNDIYQNILDLGTETKILPKTIQDVLNSQACRGAIKFGDPLSLKECDDLIQDLQYCQTPFQCAHGRPSIAPIINLNTLKISSAYRKEQFYRVNFIKLKYNRFVK
ncbi:uncharacterized protein [Lepeophtheirus salmonis]|uniref:uncharacterized protein n=1 Tax=Lepeophtheirus salmonis TaxID=72036 RepID=UPI001AE172E7|nr:uncharacterized protein LOC121116689 [Lepeophtheirus salmonis]